MAPEASNFIFQAVSVLAIVGSLLALFWQNHQAARVARAELTLSAHLHAGMIHRELTDSPEKAENLVRLLNQDAPLTAAEMVQVMSIVSLALGTHEANFGLLARGLIEEPTYRRLSHLSRVYLGTPNARKIWKILRKQGSDPRFVAELDAIVAEHEAMDTTAPNNAPP